MDTDGHRFSGEKGGAGSRATRRLFALLIACCMTAGFAIAQSPLLFGKVTDFKVPEYYEAPNQKQLKSLLKGAEAEPDPKGEVKITDVRIETYREDGTVESVVEAPHCTYNYKIREASSPGHIKAYSGDGRMRIEGDGFLLTLTNKSLTISNNIRTVIRDLGDKPLKP